MIPVPDDAVALLCQVSGAFSVGLLVVLPAVDLYHELCFQAGEVRDVRADGVLSAEAEALDLSAAEDAPQRLLCVRHGAPQVARSGSHQRAARHLFCFRSSVLAWAWAAGPPS